MASSIASQKASIRSAINDFSGLNNYFSDASTDAAYSLGETGVLAATSLVGAGAGLLENAAANAPALSGEAGSVATGVWSNGRVYLAGTPGASAVLNAANTARNAGALSVAAQSIAPDIVRDLTGDSSNTAQRIFDPAGNLAGLNNQLGNDLSSNLSDTIKSMQSSLRASMAAYQNCGGQQ